MILLGVPVDRNVDNRSFEHLTKLPAPTLIIQGEHDKYGSPASVESLAEIGIPIKGAQIQGGQLSYRIDAKTGERRLSGVGNEIRFRNAGGVAGVVKLDKDGKPESIGLYGGKAGAQVEFAASGSLAERRMWVPANTFPTTSCCSYQPNYNLFHQLQLRKQRSVWRRP